VKDRAITRYNLEWDYEPILERGHPLMEYKPCAGLNIYINDLLRYIGTRLETAGGYITAPPTSDTDFSGYQYLDCTSGYT
jgi:hypothetical protein